MKKIYSLIIALFFSASVFAAGHTVTVTPYNVNCNGICDGQATATVSGGVGPFAYDWTPSVFAGAGTANVTNLCAGSYTLTVTDSSDMSTANAIFTITEPTLLTASISGGGGTICSGSCTSLTVTAMGGTPAYAYTWAPSGAMVPTYMACPLAGGATYTVVVTDMNGCTATSVTSVGATVVPVTVNSPTICTGGTATLTGGGASAYVWSTGAGSTTINVSPATTTSYTVTGTSAGCTASAVSTVFVVPVVTVTVPASVTYCDGATVPAGIFSSTPAGATYAWTNSNPAIGIAASGVGSVPSFTAINTGATSITSTITVTPTYSGCVGTPNTYTITVDPTPTFTMPPSYTFCYGGMAIVIGDSPIGGYSYSWTPSSGLSSASISNPMCAVATTTTYTVMYTNMGCSGTATTIVYAATPITSNITSTNTTGCVICDGTASVAPIGGSGPYVFAWTPGSSSAATATSLCAGTYTVTIIDAAGCTTTDSTTVFANNSTIANFTMVPDSTNPYNFFAFNSSTGTGNSYDWSWGDGSPNSTTANPSHTYGSVGVMTVCLTAANFLCGSDTLCQTVNVTGVPASCLALFNIADDTLNPDPNAHYVYNLSYGATLSYLWDFGDGSTSTSMTPSHVYAGTGPYLLCLSVDNGAGCTDMYCDSLISADSLNRSSGTMQLVVYDLPTFYSTTGIANQANLNSISVSPNPFNDVTVFEIKSNKTEIYSFELTDVLGKKVKSKNGITEKQFEISREGLQNGIYFYKVYTAESVVGIGKVIIK